MKVVVKFGYEINYAFKSVRRICVTAAGWCITSSQPEYPKSWPEPRPSSSTRCEDITGSYENLGIGDEGEEIGLESLFFSNENFSKKTAVSHLTI